MATKTFDAKLAAIRAGDPKAVLDALASTNGILAAAAVRHADPTLLVPVFARMCEDGAKRDPGCRAKVAIAQALIDADQWEPEVFERGLTVTQVEGYDAVDTAGGLRALCGLAHARMIRPDALDVLAGLLADPEPQAQVGAAQALAMTSGTGVLRLKILLEDKDPDVLAACVESLLSIDRDQQAPFVIGLLHDHEARGEVAALALGGARIAAAVEPLIAWCAGCAPVQRERVGYVALALLRNDAANRYLLDAVRGNGKADAIAAARALATFKEEIAASLRAVAAERRDRAVAEVVEELLR
ncbi:MAG: hypothetical protein ABI175_18005 [Polyangiales bacterium]